MTLVVDGAPELDVPGVEERIRGCYWALRTVSRRELFGRIHEQLTDEDLRKLSAAAYARVCEPYEVDAAVVQRVLVDERGEQRRATVVSLAQLEAVAGPETMAEALLGIVERAGEGWGAHYLGHFRGLLRRVHRQNHPDFLDRVRSLHFEDYYLAGYRRQVLDEAALKEPFHPQLEGLHCITNAEWVDDDPELVVEVCSGAFHHRICDIPWRSLHGGGDKLLKLLASGYRSIALADRFLAQREIVSSLRSPLLLPYHLAAFQQPEHQADVRRWFQVHAEDLRPSLEALARRKGTWQTLARQVQAEL